MKRTIFELITDKGGFITKSEIPSYYDYRQLLLLVRKGELVRVRQGVYALPESLANTMYDIEKIVPGGILCSYSAWAHYNLTTQIPYGIFVAIKRGRKVNLPDYPQITLCTLSEHLLELGVTKALVGGYECKIYNIERSVCDAIKARNKIGIDVCSEIVNEYLKRPNRNLVLLTEYAKSLRVESTLRKYLEISL
ncbi:MAG: type IV toxin-antitoxin system AbiEi family antitoxin domain-containing protein [Muribaculaceae bacterium]|nr:type IV toxin-antitoxin system AbiEi family antitoxin domain-containing protein [Muribaculaceae bacterium]